MNRQDVAKLNLPDYPGVYLFKKGGEILYIGKATSLRDRVRSYFSKDIADTRGPLITQMLEEATSVAWERTDSVLEALILEAALIKKYQPKHNVKEKDNTSFNHVIVTNEDFPRVMLARGHALAYAPESLPPVKCVFGPFPHPAQLKEALKIVRRIFPFRGKTDPVPGERVRRSRLNQELGLAPDFSKTTKRDYANTVRNIKLFFEGKKKELVKKMERDMKAHARKKEFEEAEKIKHQIFALNHIQDVSLIKEPLKTDSTAVRIEGYDVAHISGMATVGVMVVTLGEEPVKSEYKKFRIRKSSGGDTAALSEILRRRLAHDDWRLPRIIVVDGGTAQKNTAERVLADFGYRIPVVAVTKDARHCQKRMLGDRNIIRKHEGGIILANTEAHRFALAYHKDVMRRRTAG